MTGDTITLGLMFEYCDSDNLQSLQDEHLLIHRTLQTPPRMEWLQTDFGARSCFFREDGHIQFSCDYTSDTIICEDTDAVRALSYELLLDGKTIRFGDGRTKRAPKGRLRGVNGIFYRTDDDIWTLNGPAKIEDPASFEALDDGAEFDIGYRDGFARDKEFVYYFDNMTDTRHAARVRGCKDPAAFRRLGPGHFTDGRFVYWTWMKLTGADPDSFQALNYSHGRDSTGIWFQNKRIKDVDPETYALIDDPREDPESPRRRFRNRGWGRDKSGMLYCDERVKEEP